MANEEINTKELQFLFLPASSGGGVVVRRAQIVGARPNGQDGAIVYTAAGPSIYTTLTTKQVANYLAAEVVEGR